MKTLLKRYKYFLGLVIINIIVYGLYPQRVIVTLADSSIDFQMYL